MANLALNEAIPAEMILTSLKKGSTKDGLLLIGQDVISFSFSNDSITSEYDEKFAFYKIISYKISHKCPVARHPNLVGELFKSQTMK